MDEELRQILDDLLASEDDTGCSYDEDDPTAFPLTVVNKNQTNKLRKWLEDNGNEENPVIRIQVNNG
jgi:hypothetical protein